MMTREVLRLIKIPGIALFIIFSLLACENSPTEPESISLEGTWHAVQSDYELTMEIIEETNDNINSRVIGDGEIINQYGTVFFIFRGEAEERKVGAGENRRKDLNITGTLANGTEFTMRLQYLYSSDNIISGVLTVIPSNYSELITLRPIAGY